MTFEEFFQKKRINLTALQAGEPGLFAEFETHFEQMGERSFDHTKKYWFNKLRLSYHLAPEQKPEKMHLENRLAEQTIVETLTESIPAPSSKAGFKPRFNSGVANADNETPQALVPDQPLAGTPASETVVPKPAGFKPRFNPKMVAPKPAEEEISSEPVAPGEPDAAEPTDAAPKPSGFKPRFNPRMVAPKPADEVVQPDPVAPVELKAAEPTEAAPKPAGFKPRFNAKMVAAKPVSEEDKVEDGTTITSSAPAEAETISAVESAPKPTGFKPRFNAKMMAPKPSEIKGEDIAKTEEPTKDTAPEAIDASPKPTGFKPRFNLKMVTAKSEETEKIEDAAAEPAVIAPEPPSEESTEEETPVSKPAGFKPRFNAAKMKPKPPQE